MSGIWVTIIILLVLGIIVGNLLLLRDANKFRIPKGFKKREYDDDKDDDW